MRFVDSEESKKEYKKFLEENERCNFQQSLEWAEVKKPNWKPEVILAENEDGNIIGSLCVWIRKMPIFGNIMYASRGPVCDIHDIAVMKQLTDGIKELLNKKYTVGNEKIRGKNYTYEEYEGSTVFMISNTPQLNEEGVKTRIYFSKDSKIAYVKTIFGDQDELLKVKLSNDVDNALFEIPANYAEN